LIYISIAERYYPITGPVSFWQIQYDRVEKFFLRQQVTYLQNNQVFNGRTFSWITKAGLPAAYRSTGRALVKARILSLY
jgi:acyl-CoA hydrolase